MSTSMLTSLRGNVGLQPVPIRTSIESLISDDAAARTYIQQAVDLIANQEFDRATAKLELADVALEDWSDEMKEPLSERAQSDR